MKAGNFILLFVVAGQTVVSFNRNLTSDDFWPEREQIYELEMFNNLC